MGKIVFDLVEEKIFFPLISIFLKMKEHIAPTHSPPGAG